MRRLMLFCHLVSASQGCVIHSWSMHTSDRISPPIFRILPELIRIEQTLHHRTHARAPAEHTLLAFVAHPRPNFSSDTGGLFTLRHTEEWRLCRAVISPLVKNSDLGRRRRRRHGSIASKYPPPPTPTYNPSPSSTSSPRASHQALPEDHQTPAPALK